jgi:hypothetical protein
MRIHRLLSLACVVATALGAGPLCAAVANYQDWWWNDQQAGQGINIGQQNDILFVSWFTYDETGAGMWLTMTAALVGNVATGNWIRTTGPKLGTTFDPTAVTLTTVGTGTLTFTSLHAASLAWTVNAKSGTLPLTRTTWAATPPVTDFHRGRHHLWVTGCPGGVTINLPMISTYTVSGAAVTVVDDFRTTGTKVCTMNGTMTPSGSYFRVEGTYSCVNNTQNGTWSGTWLVRPPFLFRDEVLLLDGSSCIYNQTTVTGPTSPQGN